MEESKRSCYFPVDIKTEKEYMQGVGNKELRQWLKTSAVFSAAALIIFLTTWSAFIAGCFLGVGIGGSFLLLQRAGTTNLSMVDEIRNVIRFAKMPKTLHYRYKGWYER